ncbi:MAG TPA: 2-hydroxychromene-2-carboxylate isomerase [Myxococcota bacterium]|nr:2-hydroxychromene-2-carboxylate isomerase [Myxococcota bacterium]
MGAAPIRFLFDYISHNAYLAWTQLGPVAARFGREIEIEPVLFAGLLNAHGQLGPAEVPPKARWMMLDVVRKARRLGVPISPPRTHPFNPLLALRVTHAAAPGEERRRLVDALFRAVWAESVDVSSPGDVARVASAAGLDGAALVAAAASDACKRRLREATDRALADGVFGVPSFIVDGALFWGFDDIGHLELFLAGKDPLQADDAARFTGYAASARRRRPDEK